MTMFKWATAASLVLSYFAIQIQIAAAESLVGHWKLDGNAADSSGIGNHGTVIGATSAPGFDGSPNGAYHFTGLFTGDQIEIPNSPSLAISGDMTVAAWIKYEGHTGTIVSRYNSHQNRNDWAFIVDGDELNMQVFPTGHTSEFGWQRRTLSADLQTDRWYHVAATFDADAGGPSMKIYIDGVEVAGQYLGTSTNVIATNDEAVRIGALTNVDNVLASFRGSIDDVRLYDEALSASQIAVLVPEPGSYALATCGAIGLAFFARRRMQGQR